MVRGNGTCPPKTGHIFKIAIRSNLTYSYAYLISVKYVLVICSGITSLYNILYAFDTWINAYALHTQTKNIFIKNILYTVVSEAQFIIYLKLIT